MGYYTLFATKYKHNLPKMEKIMTLRIQFAIVIVIGAYVGWFIL